MERIKNIMQRLHDLYHGKHQKTAIDVDLMLDYTRVMYADLLEWRRSFKEDPPTRENAEEVKAETPISAAPSPSAPQEHTASEIIAPDSQQQDTQEQTLEEVIHTIEEKKEEIIPEKSETSSTQPVVSQPPPVAPAIQQEVTKPIYQPIERDEPEVKAPMEISSEPLVKTTPEAESVNTLNKNLSGISFEPPEPSESLHVIEDELVIEEPSVAQDVETVPLPTLPEKIIPIPAIPIDEPTTELPVNNGTAPARKDIRSSIGINDKYLFLNELFNNKKEDYEDAMDRLNQTSSLDAAVNWIKTALAPQHKWDKDDVTVDTFYALLDKHFSTR